MNDPQRLSTKAIVIGLLVVFGGSFVFGVVLVIVLATAFAAKGVTESGITITPGTMRAILVGVLIIGFAFAFLGGLVAGRIAKAREVVHSIIVGVMILVIGAALSAAMGRGAGSLPVWYTLASYLLVVPSSALGGYVASRRRAHR